MTLAQFNLADDMEQALAINKGICIAGREDGEQKVLLYQLKRFYVEVFYHPRKKLITQLRGFEEMEELEPYLDKKELFPLTC